MLLREDLPHPRDVQPAAPPRPAPELQLTELQLVSASARPQVGGIGRNQVPRGATGACTRLGAEARMHSTDRGAYENATQQAS